MRKFIQLRYQIETAGFTLQQFADAIGITPTMLSQRLAGKTEWSVPLAVKACEVLKVPTTMIHSLFK